MTLATAEQVRNLKVGDRVRTTHHWGEESVVRTVTAVENNPSYGSGRWASADAGVVCPTCGILGGTPVEYCDAAWFIPVCGEGGGCDNT
jgi:hypothetical protein